MKASSSYSSIEASPSTTRSTLTEPNEAYDAALAAFVEELYDDEAFMDSLTAFTEPLIEAERVNSLALTLIKALACGVPDIYRGCEVWDTSLVDPDNRRPLDHGALARLLDRPADATPEDALALAAEGGPKLYLLRHALALRARLDLPDEHMPLEVSGPGAQHVFAFARGPAVAVVPRLVLSRPPDRGEARVALPPGRWRNVLTGEAATGRAGELLARFAVALLQRV
jgi:(1->4)-alpha-D-glucan 1-alpha-D-glucosylmutase